MNKTILISSLFFLCTLFTWANDTTPKTILLPNPETLSINPELCAGVVNSDIYLFEKDNKRKLLKFSFNEDRTKIEIFSDTLSVVTTITGTNPLPEEVLIQGYRGPEYYCLSLDGQGHVVYDGKDNEMNKRLKDAYSKSREENWERIFGTSHYESSGKSDKFFSLFEDKNRKVHIIAYNVGQSLCFGELKYYMKKQIAIYARIGESDGVTIKSDKGWVTASIDKNDLEKSLVSITGFIDNKIIVTAYNVLGKFDSHNSNDIPY
jgi:hypothetical protein